MPWIHVSIQLHPIPLHPLQCGESLQVLSILAAYSSLPIPLELIQLLFSLYCFAGTTFGKATNDLQVTKFNGWFLALISSI